LDHLRRVGRVGRFVVDFDRPVVDPAGVDLAADAEGDIVDVDLDLAVLRESTAGDRPALRVAE
jgi:hypothetical protein